MLFIASAHLLQKPTSLVEGHLLFQASFQYRHIYWTKFLLSFVDQGTFSFAFTVFTVMICLKQAFPWLEIIYAFTNIEGHFALRLSRCIPCRTRYQRSLGRLWSHFLPCEKRTFSNKKLDVFQRGALGCFNNSKYLTVHITCLNGQNYILV